MGYVNDEGSYQFQPGFGRGKHGMPYDARKPQGQYGPDVACVPAWACNPDQRRNVLLVFFERRANKSKKVPPGNYKERMRQIVNKLEAARLEEIRQLEFETSADPKQFRRLMYLRGTGIYTQWTIRVMKDYFPETEMTESWDAGQCAYRHGGIHIEKKSHVTPVIRAITKIADELYPQTETSPAKPQNELATVPDDSDDFVF